MQRYRSGHNGADSKSVCGQPHVGSNPTRSAKKKGVSFMLTPFFLMNFEDSEPRVVSLAKLHKSSHYR